MRITNEQDLQGILRIGQICGHALQHMLKHVEVGITTRELDAIGKAFLQQHNATSAPITAYNFPGWTCISVNEAIAHGIPSDYKIKAGDVVNVDVSAVLEGYWGDTGASMLVPPFKPLHKRLCDATKEALYEGINAAVAGARIFEVSRAIESVARKNRYNLLRQLTGHGVGRHIHEEPTIPNFFNRGNKDTLEEGTVVTIEPFFNLGRGNIRTAKDGWTLYTPDRSISAQYEHTIIVQGNKPIIATQVEGGH